MHLIIDISVTKGSKMRLSNALVIWQQMYWFADAARDTVQINPGKEEH